VAPALPPPEAFGGDVVELGGCEPVDVPGAGAGCGDGLDPVCGSGDARLHVSGGGNVHGVGVGVRIESAETGAGDVQISANAAAITAAGTPAT
jgi:hypothetical protein